MRIFIHLSNILLIFISEYFHDCFSTVPQLHVEKIQVVCLYPSHTNMLSKDFTIPKSIITALKFHVYLSATKRDLLKNNKIKTQQKK